MTWPMFAAFEREWELRPPVHWLVASFTGYEPKPREAAPAKQHMTPEAAMDWMKRTGGRIEGVETIGMARARR